MTSGPNTIWIHTLDKAFHKFDIRTKKVIPEKRCLNGAKFCFIVIHLLREDLITRKPLWTPSSQSLKRIQKPKKPVIILFGHCLLEFLCVFFEHCFLLLYHLVKVLINNLYFS